MMRSHSMDPPLPVKRRIWSLKEKMFLENTREAAFAYQWLHDRSSRYYIRLFNYVALPAYLIHLLVAGGAVSALQSGGSQWIQACTVALATVGMLLKAIDDTKQFKQRATEHATAASQFSELARTIRRESCKPDGEHQEATVFIAAMDDRYSQLKLVASHIPDHIVRQYETLKQHGDFDGGFEGGFDNAFSVIGNYPPNKPVPSSLSTFAHNQIARNIPKPANRRISPPSPPMDQKNFDWKRLISPSSILSAKPKRPVEIVIERSLHSSLPSAQ